MDPQIYYAIGGTLGVSLILFFAYRYLQVGGDFARARQANEIGQRYLDDAKFKEAVEKALTPPPPPPPPKPSPEPLLLLTLMQQDGSSTLSGERRRRRQRDVSACARFTRHVKKF